MKNEVDELNTLCKKLSAHQQEIIEDNPAQPLATTKPESPNSNKG